MTDHSPLHMLKSFPLHDLVFECGAAVAVKGSTATLTFTSLEKARRFMSLVNQVEPAHLGCSIEYFPSCAVASVELAPGQHARKPVDPHSMFWSDDLRNVSEAEGDIATGKLMLDFLINRLTSEVEPTAGEPNFLNEVVHMFARGDASGTSIDASKIPPNPGGVVRSPAGGLLVLDHNGHVVNLSPSSFDKSPAAVSGKSNAFTFKKG